MITYTWKLLGLKKTDTPTADGVIIGTQWKCTGVDEDGNEGVFTGATPFTQVTESTDFVPYEDLTEEIVLGWVKDVAVGYYWDHIEDQILRQINAKKNPVVEVGDSDFPWANT